jgi:23S rRNA (uracil1939-C5)-methyltransferase
MAPIHGPAWGYRQRARLSVRDVPKKGGVLVGFHERKSSFITDMRSCPVLPPHISSLLPPLRELIGSLSLRDRLPQIELAVGDDADDGTGNEVLVLRNLAALTANDERALADFADRHGVRLYLQPQGPATVQAFHPAARTLGYALADFGVRIEFQPTDFTQVNVAMNRMLVRRAIGLLEPVEGDAVADFFCGLGNFSLPIARRGAQVVGVEGSAPLVRRAQANAQANEVANRARFVVADLFEATPASLEALGAIDKALLDPPREGAIALVKALPAARLARVVYVSCNPATLARDASVLVHERGFTLRKAGIVNLFPHTAHVESVALFTR